jgi:hypothetical protein
MPGGRRCAYATVSRDSFDDSSRASSRPMLARLPQGRSFVLRFARQSLFLPTPLPGLLEPVAPLGLPPPLIIGRLGRRETVILVIDLDELDRRCPRTRRG